MNSVAGVALLATSFSVAHAQEAGSPAPDTEVGIAQDDPGGEIIVTAQKREQSIQDVPISIQVVSGETIQETGIRTFEDLGPLVPNLTVVKTPAANIISMRGIASSAGSVSLEQSVAMFVDGVYGGNARQFAAPFLDIERMEVLRGPQGALVGKNTNAGAISITTAKPGEVFGGYLRADYGLEQKGPTVEGAVDVPIAEGLAVRLTGKYSDVDGYIYNSFSDLDQPSRREATGRATVRLEQGPVTMTAKYEHSDVHVNGSPVQIYSELRGRLVDYVKETGLAFSPEFDDIKTDLGVVQFDVDVGGGHTLTTISAVSAFTNSNRIDADFTEVTGASADFDQDFEQFSQEIRLLSPTGNFLEYVLGGYYHSSSLLEERTTGVLFAPAASTYRIFDQEAEVISGYGSATFNFTDALRLITSARYTQESKSARYKRFAGPNTFTDARTGTLVADFSDDLSEGLFDPSVTVQFDATDDVMVYASFARGSKGGGFQGAISNAAPFSFEFEPERSTSYEGGVKASLRGLGHVNLALYHTRYTNLQVSTALPSPDGLSAPFFTGNAGDAIVTGAELDFGLRLGRGFRLGGNAAFTPTARYEEFTAGPCYTTQVPDGSLPGSCDLTGNRLNFTPKWSGAVTAGYEGPVGGALKIDASVTGIFSSESRRDQTKDPVALQEGYAKLDARFGIGAEDDAWEIAVVGRNLTDKATKAFVGAGGLAATVFSPDSRSLTMDAPRQILLQGSVRF